jgi:hypothetical protein
MNFAYAGTSEQLSNRFHFQARHKPGNNKEPGSCDPKYQRQFYDRRKAKAPPGGARPEKPSEDIETHSMNCATRPGAAKTKRALRARSAMVKGSAGRLTPSPARPSIIR